MLSFVEVHTTHNMTHVFQADDGLGICFIKLLFVKFMIIMLMTMLREQIWSFTFLQVMCDMGDPIYQCECCATMMWYNKILGKSVPTSNQKFSLYCMIRTVQLPKLIHAPKIL